MNKACFKKRITALCTVFLTVATVLALAGCSGDNTKIEYTLPENVPDNVSLKLDVSAPGKKVEQNERAMIDYSNTADGYVMMLVSENTEHKIKAQVKGPSANYAYELAPGELTAFPLSDGNGKYQFSILENLSGTKYALILSAQCDVVLSDEFAPFLRPNQFVNYAEAPLTVTVAQDLCKDCKTSLECVKVVYEFVTGYLSYDRELAETVKAGYRPDLDSVLRKGTGICFDYASLMTGMLRSLGIPCKLVAGYAGDAYHAWISVWVDGEGWIDNIVHFDGVNWQRMDPTFASAGSSNNEFIGNGENYLAKYFY